MYKLKVGKEADCHFNNITEAINAVPYDCSAEIFISSGIYNEKIVCEKKDIQLIGSGMENTIISFSDGGKHVHSDGRNIGTFRSYTCFFSGGEIKLKDLTIENTAGKGSVAGQAIAAYCDAEHTIMENVSLIGNQDTLFCGPLPEKERIPKGFLGPRAYSERKFSKQTFTDCYIEGDIDFIFGSGQATFENCDIVSNGEGFVCAPSTPQGQEGFIFRNCRFTAKESVKNVFLARPWREHGHVALFNCYIGFHVNSVLWSKWNKNDSEPKARFSQHGSTFPKGFIIEEDKMAVGTKADSHFLYYISSLQPSFLVQTYLLVIL